MREPKGEAIARRGFPDSLLDLGLISRPSAVRCCAPAESRHSTPNRVLPRNVRSSRRTCWVEGRSAKLRSLAGTGVYARQRREEVGTTVPPRTAEMALQRLQILMWKMTRSPSRMRAKKRRLSAMERSSAANAALRSGLHCAGARNSVKGRDERQRTAPLTPPARQR